MIYYALKKNVNIDPATAAGSLVRRPMRLPELSITHVPNTTIQPMIYDTVGHEFMNGL